MVASKSYSVTNKIRNKGSINKSINTQLSFKYIKEWKSKTNQK